MGGLCRYNRGIPLYQIYPSEVYKLYLEIKREDSLIYVYDLTNLYFLRGIKVWNVSALDMGYSTAQGRLGLKNGEYNTLILFECLLADITRQLSA